MTDINSPVVITDNERKEDTPWVVRVLDGKMFVATIDYQTDALCENIIVLSRKNSKLTAREATIEELQELIDKYDLVEEI